MIAHRSTFGAAALLLLLAACGDSPTKPPKVAEVSVSAPAGDVIVGSQLQLSASTLDSKGNALVGREIAWISQNEGIATVSATGLLSAVAPGTVTISAVSEGRTGTTQVVVRPVPVASVFVSPTQITLEVGKSQQLNAVPRNLANNPLPNRVVTWNSRDDAIATVVGGNVTAQAVGTVVIEATSEGRTGTATVTVIPKVLAPVIDGIAPATLVPGTAATITGTGFHVLTTSNQVTVGGVSATVTSASPTQLVVRVPCVQTGDASVRVTVGQGSSGDFLHPIAVTRRTLQPGESLIIDGSDAAVCNELASSPATARYLVTVFNVALSANALTSIELGGNVPPTGADAVPVVSTGAIREASVPDATEREAIARERAHMRQLERIRRDFEIGQARMRALPASERMQLREAAEPPVPGEMRSLWFNFQSCTNAEPSNQMRVKAIYVGPRAIIWEDSTNAIQSGDNPALANFYQRLGEIYDRDQHGTVHKYFADPLLRDAETDADGRIHMVYSQRLNGSGAAAYVTGCDQFPTTVFAASNFGQYFYGSVPTQAALNLNSTAAPDGWFAFMARTVVHEVKHIASLSARVANNAASFEQSWLEEGTARMAEEMWVRDSMHRTPWKSNAGWTTDPTRGIYCDFHLFEPACVAADPIRRPSWGVRRQFNEIREKLIAPHNWSPYGDGTGQSGAVFYNSTWSLVRYAIDRYATSEEAFLTQLTNATTSGTANLSAVSGAPIDRLIGGWGMALFADDYPGMPGGNADIQFQTWNLRSIYAGLNASPSWSGRFNTPFPILPTQLPSGGFSTEPLQVRGGAHAYYIVPGATVAQLLSLKGSAGSPLDPSIRVAIVRLQ